KIKEEMYVCQPPGFKDLDYPDRVYKVKKALYRLHQAPKAWYKTLSTYMLDNGFQRGKINKTLFIKRHKDEFYGRTYILLGITKVKTASTSMETQKPLLKDEDGKEVDVHMYRSMIGSLMYLTSSRPDIMFAVCACAGYQVNLKISHLHVVKRIFRCLKGQLKLGLWYPKDSPFNLVAYTGSDYARASLDRKSTTGGKAKKRVRLMMEKLFEMELELMPMSQSITYYCWVNVNVVDVLVYCYGQHYQLGSTVICQSRCMIRNLDNVSGKILMYPRKPTRKDTQVPQPSGPTESVTDEAVHKQLGDRLVRGATTASSLEAEQDSGGGPRCQETIGILLLKLGLREYPNNPMIHCSQEDNAFNGMDGWDIIDHVAKALVKNSLLNNTANPRVWDMAY
nr:hypothetical protein [Tanacetum cinerariifolium]